MSKTMAAGLVSDCPAGSARRTVAAARRIKAISRKHVRDMGISYRERMEPIIKLIGDGDNEARLIFPVAPPSWREIRTGLRKPIARETTARARSVRRAVA